MKQQHDEATASDRPVIVEPSAFGRTAPERWVWILGALLGLTVLFGCADQREQQSRKAVRRLAQATPSAYEDALDPVVALGRYALVDIEQQLHEAEADQRLHLLEAVDRIGDPDGVPLLRFWSLRADDARVRRKAAQALQRLR
jgi:HEAT repeat protein